VLRRAPGQVALADLLALAKASPERRAAAVERFAGRGMASLRGALADLAREDEGEPTEAEAIEAAFKALAAAWKRAPTAARRRFMHEFAEDLSVLEGGDA
jgi:ParB family chromosome partitioning protein